MVMPKRLPIDALRNALLINQVNSARYWFAVGIVDFDFQSSRLIGRDRLTNPS
jgi:hypothetical protein